MDLKLEIRPGRHNPLYVIKATLWGMRDIPSLDVSRLSIPTLIFAGEFDQIIPANTVRNFYEKIPQHQYFLIKQAAHMLMLEQPEAVNILLREWLG